MRVHRSWKWDPQYLALLKLRKTGHSLKTLEVCANLAEIPIAKLQFFASVIFISCLLFSSSQFHCVYSCHFASRGINWNFMQYSCECVSNSACIAAVSSIVGLDLLRYHNTYGSSAERSEPSDKEAIISYFLRLWQEWNHLKSNCRLRRPCNNCFYASAICIRFSRLRCGHRMRFILTEKVTTYRNLSLRMFWASSAGGWWILYPRILLYLHKRELRKRIVGGQ